MDLHGNKVNRFWSHWLLGGSTSGQIRIYLWTDVPQNHEKNEDLQGSTWIYMALQFHKHPLVQAYKFAYYEFHARTYHFRVLNKTEMKLR